MNDDAVRKLSAYVIARRLKPRRGRSGDQEICRGVADDKRDQKLTEMFAAALSRTNDERKIVHVAASSVFTSASSRAPKKSKPRASPAAAGRSRRCAACPRARARLALPAKSKTSRRPSKDDPEEKMKWEVRVFQERQQNIPIACEIPQLMDERAGLVARAIRALMKS